MLSHRIWLIAAAALASLYQFNTGGSLGGGVVSYELDGNQYVAVVSGVVSGFFGGTGLPTVIVFGLR